MGSNGRYIARWVIMFVALIVSVWLALMVVVQGVERHDRCVARDGVMTRDWQCVQKVEGF